MGKRSVVVLGVLGGVFLLFCRRPEISLKVTVKEFEHSPEKYEGRLVEIEGWGEEQLGKQLIVRAESDTWLSRLMGVFSYRITTPVAATHVILYANPPDKVEKKDSVLTVDPDYQALGTRQGAGVILHAPKGYWSSLSSVPIYLIPRSAPGAFKGYMGSIRYQGRCRRLNSSTSGTLKGGYYLEVPVHL